MPLISISDKSAIQSLIERLTDYVERPGMNGVPSNLVASAKSLIHLIFQLRNDNEWKMDEIEAWWILHQSKFNLTLEPNKHVAYRMQLYGVHEELAYSQVLTGMKEVWVQLINNLEVYKEIKDHIEILFTNDSFSLSPDDLEITLYAFYISATIYDKKLVRDIYFSKLKEKTKKNTLYKCFASVPTNLKNDNVLDFEPINFQEYEKVSDLIRYVIQKL